MEPENSANLTKKYEPLTARHLVDKTTFEQLKKPNNLISGLYALNHISLLVVTGFFLVQSVGQDLFFIAPLLFLVYCSIYNFLSPAGAMHEFCHGRVFTNRSVNKAIYKFLGYMTWTNPALFQVSHFKHHRDFLSEDDIEGELGNIEKPRLIDVCFLFIPKPQDLFRRLYYNALTMRGTFRNENIRQLYENSGRQKEIQHDALLIFLLHGAIALISILSQSVYPTLLLSLPSFFSRYFIFVLARSQHNISIKTTNTYNQVSASVSLRLPFFIQALYWSMNFHSEHHLFPAVPHHNLQKLQDVLVQQSEYSQHFNLTTMSNEITGQYVER